MANGPGIFLPPGGPFTPHSAKLGSAGTTGGIVGAPAVAPIGVVIAFDDPWDAVNPTWTRIDDPNAVDLVTGWSIDRGRSYELDKTATGSATVRIIDLNGLLDPTNSTSPYYGKIEPRKQAAIILQNPANGAWTMVFRGFIDGWNYTVDVSEKYMTAEIDLVDALEFFSTVEVIPAQHGIAPPAGSGVQGDVLYAAQQVDDRIRAALADAQWPDGYSVIFSGNVAVQDTVYAPRTQILSVIQDAADAEWPGVANFYIAKTGEPTFHGRLARFNPSAYGIAAWKCGDLTAYTGDSTRAVISGLQFSRDLPHVINSGLATPQGIRDEDIAGQVSNNTGSIATYGTRTWSAENLITLHGDETGTPDALTETAKFSQYYPANYGSPRNRISQVTFRPLDPSSAMGLTTWTLMCDVEIGDTITVTVTHPGGGGFNEEPFFVEGIHYDARPMNATNPEVTVTLDLSPQGYFNDSGALFSPH